MSKANPRNLIVTWYERAQLDYCDLYMRLFVSYNSWFRQVTAQPNDRACVNALKKRFVIWDDYRLGRSMLNMETVLKAVAIATKNDDSLGVEVKDAYDWQNVIEFWYQVRCHLFHGSHLFSDGQQTMWAKLAYESLNIFMTEVVNRMNRSFTNDDYRRLQEVQALLRAEGTDTNRLLNIYQLLQQKYIRSPDIWNVDMIHI